MSRSIDDALLSPLTGVGALWSLATLFLLYVERGKALTRDPRLLLVTGPLMALAVSYVAAEVDVIRTLAGGLDPLDVHLGYAAEEIVILAEALGASGRRAYAAFQLGADTLAPPAFACFILNITRSTVRLDRARRVLVALISVYFFSVLAANALMPLVMLSYPDQSGALGVLYTVAPILDSLKYGSHGIAWLIVLGCWAVALYRRLRPPRA